MRLICLSLSVLGIFVGCDVAPAPKTVTPPVANSPANTNGAANGAAKPTSAIPLSVKTWKETEALIAKHKGKVVVVDLWSTWCQPCVEEFPGLVKLHEKHKGDVVCISVNLNYSGAKGETPEDSRAEVLKFLTEQKANFENILCADQDTDVYKTLNLAAVPAVLVYDKTGQMRKRFDNEKEEFGEAGFKYEQHIGPFVNNLLSE